MNVSDPSPPTRLSVRPMSLFEAVGWVLGITFLFLSLVLLIVGSRPAAPGDIVGSFGCQAVAYLLGLFFILRVYAPDASISDFVGLRRTHFAFYPLAILLGAALEIPANATYDAIEHRFPSGFEDGLLEIFRDASMANKTATVLIVVALGPLLEEIFFRGALWKPLECRYGATLRIVLITAILFAVAHQQWQMYPPIGMVGLSLGLLRQASGSIGPPIVLHATFNGLPFLALATSRLDSAAPDTPIPVWLIVVGSLATVALLGIVYLTGRRTDAAAHAQEFERR